MFTLGQLPIRPSLGAAAAVLILGAYADRRLACRLAVSPEVAVAPTRA
jgi:hypothetical protein